MPTLERVVTLVADVGHERPTVDRGTRRVSLPVEGGARSLVEVVRRLDEAGIKVIDITLRRPSLDDVFLALTGHTTVSGTTDERAVDSPKPSEVCPMTAITTDVVVTDAPVSNRCRGARR